MRLAFLGLSASGKTTLFNALTGAHASVGAYSGVGTEIHIGRMTVEDSRLKAVRKLFKPQKVTPAVVEVVDTPPLAVATHENREGNARLIATLREARALVLVIRAFADERVPHPKVTIDPKRDFDDLNAELVIADLDVAEKRIQKLHKAVHRGTADAVETKELHLLERCRERLDAGRSLTALDLNADEQKIISPFAFLTLKPVLVVVNVGEEVLGGEKPRTWTAQTFGGRPHLEVCAEWEMEVHELPEAEQAPYLADLGITERCEKRFVKAAYELLDMITFFTCNQKELRAWQLPRYSKALDAATEVHTDMARGFIRAEVIGIDDVRSHRSLKDIRADGKERIEGKTGPVHDGDLIHFRFSV